MKTQYTYEFFEKHLPQVRCFFSECNEPSIIENVYLICSNLNRLLIF